MNTLSRDQFREQVFARDRKLCVICGKIAIDAHHIMERKLFEDGGYDLNNGCSLCGECHILAEQTRISTVRLRQAAGITVMVLPPWYNAKCNYDKWGNLILQERRIPGEMFHLENVQKALKWSLAVFPKVEIIMDIIKYPRTQHVQGSRLQPGDEDLEQVPLKSLIGKYLVIEEKQDGANSGISFDSDVKLYLQSRGHFFHGGIREAQFTLMKQWATTFAEDFYMALGDRHIAYGEWLYKKHTVFYDNLPHFWAEFDIYDKQDKVFLDTARRKAICNGLPIVPVKVLWEGVWTGDMRFEDFVVKSHFKTDKWREALKAQVDKCGFNWDLVWKHTDQTDLMEGLYIKWEEDGIVKGRYKYVRHDFVSLIISNDEHHDNLPPVPNMLATGIDLFKTSV